MMTRVRVASVLVAVVAGDYALLTLVNGRLTDFGVTAGIWVGCSTAAGLIAYASRRRRQAMARDVRLFGSAVIGRRLPLADNSARHAETRANSQANHPDSLTGSVRACAGYARLVLTPESTRRAQAARGAITT